MNETKTYISFPGLFLPDSHPAAQLSKFSASSEIDQEKEKGAFAALVVAKTLRNR